MAPYDRLQPVPSPWRSVAEFDYGAQLQTFEDFRQFAGGYVRQPHHTEHTCRLLLRVSERVHVAHFGDYTGIRPQDPDGFIVVTLYDYLRDPTDPEDGVRLDMLSLFTAVGHWQKYPPSTINGLGEATLRLLAAYVGRPATHKFS